MTFTLPTAGKSGCMVCHGDPNLGRLEGSQWVSYYVEGTPLDNGPHAQVLCTGCHLDFAYKAPHESQGNDWVRTARLACKNCHQDQWTAYSLGVHSIAVQPGEKITEEDAAKPLCGDCHGPSHDIAWLTDNPAGRQQLHASGYEVCGRCHEDYWNGYSDYYHGAAYRHGAKDAPACWDCHDYHSVLPSTNRDSTVYKDNIRKTCNQCHKDVNDQYLSYTGMVHQRSGLYAENPLYSLVQETKATIQDFWGTVRSWFS